MGWLDANDYAVLTLSAQDRVDELRASQASAPPQPVTSAAMRSRAAARQRNAAPRSCLEAA